MRFARSTRTTATVLLAAGSVLPLVATSPAQATTCPKPVALKQPVAANVGDSNGGNGGAAVGTLYLGYFAAPCRETYAEFHLADITDAAVINYIDINVYDVITGREYGDAQFSGETLINNGGWATTALQSIDGAFYSDPVEPVVRIRWLYSNYSCGMVGWTHEFDNGQATDWDTGHFGDPCEG